MISYLFQSTINRNAFLSAFISFIIGSILFLIYLLFKPIPIIYTGFIYVIIATIVNFIYLIRLLANLIIEINKIETLYTIAMSLLNIPIAILYFNLLFIL